MSEAIENLSVILLTLRKKLFFIAATLFLGIAVSFQFTGPLIEKIKTDLLPEGAKLVYVTPLEVMILKLKLSFIIGALLALPLVIYYIWKSLKNRFSIKNPSSIKTRHIILLIGTAGLMFLLGASYAYFLMLPLFLKYLYLSAAGAGAIATYSIFKFITFAAAATVLFGLIFELPLVLTLLTRSGIVKYETLVTYRRHLYILFLFIGAVITPPEVFSQLMVAVPMIIFFEISMLIVRILGSKKVKKE
ncbi:MAG: Sec-independent protein translocase TatC [Methanosarcinaceae archaeon]|nr:Sec-independent protein translocase TatC [Methanosarcinaceae archaeon]MDD4331922.1 Sec-independent protein translocase TatC [Methanosarcinaceae archaeon]